MDFILVLIYLCYNTPMKTIYLIRHAKSDWSDFNINDAKRGLSERGKKDIPLMANELHKKNIKPDLIISSSSNRTKLTVEGIFKRLNYSTEIIYNDELYLANPKTILSLIQNVNDKYKSIFVVGHNPGITDFANLMSDADIENIPTLGIVALKCEVKKWKECKYHDAKVEFFIYPKMFKK